MDNIQHLEYEYLRAKIAYYEGKPIMTDAAFDHIEQQLKEAGSKVIEQVGSKRKDFDFTHPTRMKSLAKFQTEQIDGVTNYADETFMAWYNKRKAIIGEDVFLWSSPKFDGNAINIIYKGKNLLRVLTRGNGLAGKDITERFKAIVPNELVMSGITLKDDDIVEVRCEVVIDVSIFNEKYSDKANPRNFVAGVIGDDEGNAEKIADLSVIPLVFLLNGEHVDKLHFRPVPLYNNCTRYYRRFDAKDYVKEIQSYEELREDFEYQLDGVVISFPIQFRAMLGENDHDPEWAVAIKFVPDQVITQYVGIEWNVGKTGELAPVVLLKPVQLAGTTVKRASGYNAGYITKNKIGPGAVFSVAKAGDIIPEIQTVEVPASEAVKLPTVCPSCGESLEFDGIHLMCTNEKCAGKVAKKLGHAGNVIDLKGVGGTTLIPFAKDFPNMFELMRWVLSTNEMPQFSLEKFGIKKGSRSQEIFVKAFTNIKSLTYEQVIVMLGYDNVGRKLSAQIAREHCGLEANYASLERALVAKLHEPEVEKYIKLAVSELESLGVTIDKPKVEKKEAGTVYVCMTGSPKEFGFKTKEEFIKKFPNLVEVSLTDKNCNFLITDSYSSTSSKMGVAKKKGIPIKTYGDYTN